MTFDPHKPARTRDGRPATLIGAVTGAHRCYHVSVPPTENEKERGCRDISYAVDKDGVYTFGLREYLNLENYTPEPTPAPQPPAFDPTKPVQTRDGRKARIICTDRKATSTLYAEAPIIALVEDGEGNEHPQTFAADGKTTILHPSTNGQDLINTPEERTAWVVSYRTAIDTFEAELCWSEASAHWFARAKGSRLFSVTPVTLKEGQGLPPAEPN